MFSAAAWNIRGLNQIPKQTVVQEVVNENGLKVCALLESHVDISKLQSICANVFKGWMWTSNNQYSQGGTRIIVGWDPDSVDLMVINQSDQVLHCQVQMIGVHKTFNCSFIYASNHYVHRRELWNILKLHHQFVAANPWILKGDFNVSLSIEDSISGISGMTIGD